MGNQELATIAQRMDGSLLGWVAKQFAGNNKIWSRERELNSRPADYESAALPLSYLGLAVETKAFSYFGSCIINSAFVALRVRVGAWLRRQPRTDPQ